MRKEFLGEFEELVLMLTAILKEEAYGQRILQLMNQQAQRDVQLSAIHVTLYRLEDKGLVTSQMGGITSERGGRRKRIFRITNSGLNMLRYLKDLRTELWKQIPNLK